MCLLPKYIIKICYKNVSQKLRCTKAPYIIVQDTL